MNINAILFDLDNTLILFDEKQFFKTYSKKLYYSFMDLLPPEKFMQKLLSSTKAMTENDGKCTNAEFFINDFANGLSVEKSDLWQRFEKFYMNEFDQFELLMTPLKNTDVLFQKIQENGLKIVIASNPMFPENLQRKRLRWAGLDGFSFDLITHVNNSTFCKPNLNYYLEICEKINSVPEKCLMVGNDRLNDMIASKTGMKTYLTTDGKKIATDISRKLVQNSNVEIPKPDFTGKLKDLIKIIDNKKS